MVLKRLAVTFVSIFAFILISSSPAWAAKPTQSGSNHGGGTVTPSTLGNDISWPQCGKALPSGQAFGIVGVNNGYATLPNPCLSSELTWSSVSNGSTNQPKTQLYVNTANPGGLGTTSWPTNNIDPLGNDVTTSDPYGACNGSDNQACAWQYGWNRTNQDVNQFLAPIAVDPFASDYNWWLDVETINSWETGTVGLANNAATLQGMVNYLASKNVSSIGLYSTSYQWGKIVGSNNPNNVFSGLGSWLPGAKSQKAAQNNCGLAPLVTGGKVSLTQFVSNNFDYDFSCI